MTLGFGIKLFFEIMMVLLIAYGIMNEEKLIAFEDELYPVLKFCFRKYILRNIKTNKSQPKAVKTHSKAALRVISGKKSVETKSQGVA